VRFIPELLRGGDFVEAGFGGGPGLRVKQTTENRK